MFQILTTNYLTTISPSRSFLWVGWLDKSDFQTDFAWNKELSNRPRYSDYHFDHILICLYVLLYLISFPSDQFNWIWLSWRWLKSRFFDSRSEQMWITYLSSVQLESRPMSWDVPRCLTKQRSLGFVHFWSIDLQLCHRFPQQWTQNRSLLHNMMTPWCRAHISVRP